MNNKLKAWLEKERELLADGRPLSDFDKGMVLMIAMTIYNMRRLEADPEPGADEFNAFVAGAAWWEFHKSGGTMWQSDRAIAEAEAERRYGPAKTDFARHLLDTYGTEREKVCEWRWVETAGGRWKTSCKDLQLIIPRGITNCPRCGGRIQEVE